jgi:hypothetical protein
VQCIDNICRLAKTNLCKMIDDMKCDFEDNPQLPETKKVIVDNVSAIFLAKCVEKIQNATLLFLEICNEISIK